MNEDNQESLEELKKISFKLEKLEKTNGTIKVLLTSIGIGMFSFALVFGLTSSIKAAVWTFVLGVVATETENVLKKGDIMASIESRNNKNAKTYRIRLSDGELPNRPKSGIA